MAALMRGAAMRAAAVPVVARQVRHISRLLAQPVWFGVAELKQALGAYS